MTTSVSYIQFLRRIHWSSLSGHSLNQRTWRQHWWFWIFHKSLSIWSRAVSKNELTLFCPLPAFSVSLCQLPLWYCAFLCLITTLLTCSLGKFCYRWLLLECWRSWCRTTPWNYSYPSGLHREENWSNLWMHLIYWSLLSLLPTQQDE